jgi:hypothetical protein
MQPRFIAKAFLRLALAVSVVAIMAPLASHDAEAGRAVRRHSRGVGAAITARAAAASAREGVSNTNSAEESEAGGEDHKRADVDAASAPAVLPRASVAKVLKAASVVNKDDDVPGCGAGNLCTVCVAGCNGEVNAIVHSVPKAQRAE